MDVFKYHNLARTDPRSFIPMLEDMLPRFEGNIYNRPNNPVNLRTKEGPAAVIELIEFLKKQQHIEALEW